MIKKESLFPKLRTSDKRVIAARVLVVLMMISNLTFIWIQSSKTAADSTKISTSITKTVAPIVVSGFKKMPKPQQNAKIKELNNKLRTLAHSLEYVPMGVLILLLLVLSFNCKSLNITNVLTLGLISILSGLTFAVFDEIHQIFVKGRAFELKDICLDMAGMAVGYGFCAGIIKLKNSCIKNRRNAYENEKKKAQGRTH